MSFTEFNLYYELKEILGRNCYPMQTARSLPFEKSSVETLGKSSQPRFFNQARLRGGMS